MTRTRMDVLCYMAVASDLFNTACENYSEADEVEDVKARLHLAQVAINQILERIGERP